MGVAADIGRSLRHGPRAVMRDQLAQGINEPRALAVLMLGCALIFVAQWPRLMREARAKGFRVVPGSDPFPFGGDYRRVGRFGLCLDMSPPRVGLWRSIQTLLTGDSPPPRSYGRRVYPARFLFNNVAVQLVRRLKPGLS